MSRTTAVRIAPMGATTKALVPLVLWVLLAASGSTKAAEPPAGSPSPTAQAALQTLLESQVGRADPGLREVAVTSGSAPVSVQVSAPTAPSAATGAAGAAAVSSTGRTVLSVARGQSLDAVLRQHLAASPLRIEVLRELVRQLNPQAFAPGAGYRLQAGARLQLPTVQDQAQHAFGKALALSERTADRSGDDRGGSAGGSAAAARKGWVRYP